MRKILTILTTLFFSTILLKSQTVQIEWQKRISGSGYEVAYDIITLANGNYLIAGTTSSIS